MHEKKNLPEISSLYYTLTPLTLSYTMSSKCSDWLRDRYTGICNDNYFSISHVLIDTKRFNCDNHDQKAFYVNFMSIDLGLNLEIELAEKKIA